MPLKKTPVFDIFNYYIVGFESKYKNIKKADGLQLKFIYNL